MKYIKIECLNMSSVEFEIDLMQRTFSHVEFVSYVGTMLTVAYII